MLPRFGSLRQARLEDLRMAGGSHIFWPADGSTGDGTVLDEGTASGKEA
jgi:hypothetical protein